VTGRGRDGGDSPHDTLTLNEALYQRAALDDLAGDVAAEDGRELVDEDALVLDLPVDGIDGDGVVLDQDLVRVRAVARGLLDDKRLALWFFDPLAACVPSAFAQGGV